MNGIWDYANCQYNIAILDEYGHKVTYQEIEIISKSLGGIIDKRCLVFSLCRNTIGSVCGYAAFMDNNIVTVLLSSQLNEELLDKLISVYKPDFLWIPTCMSKKFNDLLCVYSCYDYSLLKTKFDNIYLLNNELALLLTTSGSTGSPKFVRQSYINLIDNAHSIVEYLKINSKERPITSLPMNYVYGLSVINSHFMVGATILVTEKSIMQKEFWQFCKDAEATSLAGVPYTYEMLDRLRFYRMDLPRLHTLTQAGGKLLPELQEKFARYAEENGKKFVVMYGAAEATARMGYLPPEMAVRKKGAMGVAIPGGNFSLIDEDGKEIIEPNITGELVYMGKNVTLGYAECGEDLIKGDERNGVLYTGDMARFDEDGFYYIVGRKKRFLKIYGNRVNLDEIERLIKGKFSIEAATTGMDDHLYIFVTDSKYVPEIKSFIVSLTKLYQAAFKVAVIDEIPKNSSGKPLYNELMKFVQAR